MSEQRSRRVFTPGNNSSGKLCEFTSSESLDTFACRFIWQLQEDATCPWFVNNYYFKTPYDVLIRLHSAEVEFLPGVLEFLVSAKAPSWQFFAENTLELRKGYGIYILIFRLKVVDQLTGETHYIYKAYLGKATNKAGGIVTRFRDYDHCRDLSEGVQDAIQSGWELRHRSIIAWAPPTQIDEHPETSMLFYALEATFSHAFSMHKPSQTKSMEKAYWNSSMINYVGLCNGSSLREIWDL